MNQNKIADASTTLHVQGGKPKSGLSFAANLGLHTGVAILVFAGLLLFYGNYYPLHHDLAGSVLSGRLAVTLGDTFRDYSLYFPPSEKFWFSAAARLSDVFGLRLHLVIVMMTGAVVLSGAGLAYWIRLKAVGASPLFFIFSVAVLVITPILFKNVFGLREHLVAVGLWPYLVLRVSDADGSRIDWKLKVVVGLWMGIFLLFKYLYCIVVILLELADSLAQRRYQLLFRTENLLAGATVFFYLFLWLGIDPSQRAAIGAMFSAIDANLMDPRDNWLKAFENLYIAAFLLGASRILQSPKRPAMLGVAVVVGVVIAAWSQERWYTHHLFPITLAYIFWWWLLTKNNSRWWLHAVMALFVLLPVSREFFSISVYHQQLAELEKAIADGKQSVAGKRVAILNMHPSPYNQYLARHDAVRWTPMMNNAYVSAELKSFDRKENAGMVAPPIKLADPGRRSLHEQMLHLWEDLPPDVLIVDRTSSWPLRYVKVDWTHVFSREPRFKAFLANYRPVQVYNGSQIRFTYYVRAD